MDRVRSTVRSMLNRVKRQCQRHDGQDVKQGQINERKKRKVHAVRHLGPHSGHWESLSTSGRPLTRQVTESATHAHLYGEHHVTDPAQKGQDCVALHIQQLQAKAREEREREQVHLCNLKKSLP